MGLVAPGAWWGAPSTFIAVLAAGLALFAAGCGGGAVTAPSENPGVFITRILSDGSTASGAASGRSSSRAPEADHRRIT